MTNLSKPQKSAFIPYSGGDLYLPALHELDEDTVQPYGTAVFEQPITDHWIHSGLNLPKGEETKKVIVVGQSKDENGNIIGKYDSNPILNTMVYDVKFTDGSIHEYGENVMVDNIYSQVDSEGFHTPSSL